MTAAANSGCGAENMPVVVVSGFMRCGMATTMAMLEAGGLPIAGGAHPPTYELFETSCSVRGVVRDIFPPGLVEPIEASLPPAIRDFGQDVEIDPVWFASLRGQAVKLVFPHLLKVIPRGDHRVIWLDRDEQDRARSLARYMGIPETGLTLDWLANYFASRRPHARAALVSAGASILDVRHEDLIGGAERCRLVVDRIVDFIERPLDRAAMIKRAGAAIW